MSTALSKNNIPFCPLNQRAYKPDSGAVLLFIIIALVVLGILGVVLASIYSSSRMGLYKPNFSKKSSYLAESGVRYGISELRNASSLNATMDRINSTPSYSMGTTEGNFTLEASTLLFLSESNQTAAPGTPLNVRTVKGKLPASFSIPSRLYAVGNDPVGQRRRITALAGNSTHPVFSVNGPFQINKGGLVYLATRIVPPVTPDTITIDDGGGIFPDNGGVFSVIQPFPNGSVYHYFYDHKQETAGGYYLLTLAETHPRDSNIYYPADYTTLSSGEYVLLSTPSYKNFLLTSKGQAGRGNDKVTYEISDNVAHKWRQIEITGHAPRVEGTGTPTKEEIFGTGLGRYQGIEFKGKKLDETVLADLGVSGDDNATTVARYGNNNVNTNSSNGTTFYEVAITISTTVDNSTQHVWTSGSTFPFSLHYSNATDVLSWEVNGTSLNSTFPSPVNATRVVGNFFIQTIKPDFNGIMTIDDLSYQFDSNATTSLAPNIGFSSGDQGLRFLLTQQDEAAGSLTINGNATFGWTPPAFPHRDFGFEIHFFLFDIPF